MTRPGLASAAVLGSAAIWGLYWLPLRSIEEAGLTGGWVMALFNVPALIGAMVVLLVMRRHPTGGSMVMVAGMVGGTSLALYGIALVMTSVVKATMLFYLTPVWGTLIGMAVLGERPGAMRWGALVCALLGLALMLGIGADDIIRRIGIGEGIGLIAGLLWALAATLIRRQAQAGPALTLWQFVGVIGASAGLSLLMGWPPPTVDTALAAFSPFVIAMSLFIFATYYMLFWGVARLSPGRSGMLMMSEVVVAVLTAAILLPEEALTATEWAGVGLLILAGVAEASSDAGQQTRG